MEKPFFGKKKLEAKAEPTPYELIEPEIVHLKKGYSIRYGEKKPRHSIWLLVLGFSGLAWLYLMDPPTHAWYKGEAIRDYLYLHNYGTAANTADLVASRILSPGDITLLSQRTGNFQDYYPSVQAAKDEAEAISDYMTSVRLLHTGRYPQLGPVGRMRYLLFIRTGIILPISWDFLDPVVQG